MKTLVKNNCTGCHTLSYILQHRFDEDGWHKIIELMKNVNVSGINVAHERKVNGMLDKHQKELASYLAQARGPGESSMKLKLRPRPTGEAARVVFTEYDVPLEDSAMNSRPLPDGSDWTQGSPSKFGELLHDSEIDDDGNLWFTVTRPTTTPPLAGSTPRAARPRCSGWLASAASRPMPMASCATTRACCGSTPIPAAAASAASIPRPKRSTSMCRRRACRRPAARSPSTSTRKGKVWVTSPDGALHFDPDTEKFTEFKSGTFKTPNGAIGTTYGLAADRDGNGWWLQMALDVVNKGDIKTGKITELKLPPVKAEMDRITDPELVKFYEGFAPPDFNTPVPWTQGPRRMGADKNADVVWVGTSWGASLVRINTKTHGEHGRPAALPGHVALPDHGRQEP